MLLKLQLPFSLDYVGSPIKSPPRFERNLSRYFLKLSYEDKETMSNEDKEDKETMPSGKKFQRETMQFTKKIYVYHSAFFLN